MTPRPRTQPRFQTLAAIAEQPPQNIINHFAFVLDASGSMDKHKYTLIKVVDNQIKHLAVRSKELDQETRISVWSFSDASDIRCLIWDKDVLRLPSIAQYYRINGMTALVDAMMKSFHDMGTTSQIYGNHSFLYYCLTDGEENASVRFGAHDLAIAIKGQDDNVTVAALVPNAQAVMEAKKLGFPAGNIQVWDTTSTEGLEQAGRSITASTDAYMTARATTGLRSTTSLFDMSPAAVNKTTIQAAGLTPLPSKAYMLVPVPRDGDIKDFTENQMGLPYVTGRGYYQLSTQAVNIQANKEIAVHEKASGKVYVGDAARTMIGLPVNMTVSVKAGRNPDYDIFVQSTSVNRKLRAGTKFLYLVR